MGRYTYLVEKHTPAEDTRTPPRAETSVLPADPVPPGRGVPPTTTKRVMKQRQPFDIYQDQYDALKQIALEERMQGGVGSMSAMVREAIDRLIAEKRIGKKPLARES